MQTIPTPQNQLRHTLRQLGFSAHHSGYRLVAEAIVMYTQNSAQSITKALYPALAKQFPAYSAVNIERAIRYAINEAWEHGPREQWQQYFPHLTKAPANACFIATLAEELM